MKRQVITYEYSGYDVDLSFDINNLKDTIHFLQQRLDEVPIKYQDTAEIDMSYENCYVTIKVFYDREYTKQELKDMEKRWKDAEELNKQQELKTLARLKEKYEKN